MNSNMMGGHPSRYGERDMRGAWTKKKPNSRSALFFLMAEWTGLEPATPGVTGRYSNQLNYHSRYFTLLEKSFASQVTLVGADGIEPPTFAL